MAVEQQIIFVLNLSLAESYIYGTAIMSYLINIQQAADKLVVLPAFFNIESSNYFFCSMQDPKYSRLID